MFLTLFATRTHARARALSLSHTHTHTLLRGFVASARRRTPLVLFFFCPKKEIASEVRGKCEANNTSFPHPPSPLQKNVLRFIASEGLRFRSASMRVRGAAQWPIHTQYVSTFIHSQHECVCIPLNMRSTIHVAYVYILHVCIYIRSTYIHTPIYTQAQYTSHVHAHTSRPF